jgi:hypothetical protein
LPSLTLSNLEFPELSAPIRSSGSSVFAPFPKFFHNAFEFVFLHLQFGLGVPRSLPSASLLLSLFKDAFRIEKYLAVSAAIGLTKLIGNVGWKSSLL